MKKDNWVANTNRIKLWLDIEDRGDAGDAITFTIGLGDKSKSEEMLTNYWTAIRNIGSEFDDFPKARVGQNDVLSIEERMSADSVHVNLVNAFATIGDSFKGGEELILATILPHGRTGGVYDSMESFANVVADKAIRDLVDAKKEGRWNGEMNGIVPVVTPRPLNTKKNGGSEEE